MTCEGKCGDCLMGVSENVQVADGISVHQIRVPKPGLFVAQHAHAYDHLTLVASGRVRLWKDRIAFGEFNAGELIKISANDKHGFESLEPSVLYCIHNVSRSGEVEISERNNPTCP